MLAPNTILQNRYLIIRAIGQGGMGTVYLANDQRLGNAVALKETFFTDARMRRAFEREARLLASLRHSALTKVIDHFDEGDGQFLVMEFIAGDDLEMMLAQHGGPFPPPRVLHWADQLLDALEYLHTQETPILHRDIKPANLKLTARDQIILLDFGLAKGTTGEMTSVAASRSVLGYTPNFAPLEQIQGTGTDSRSDLYSLGATLYYLMTGAIPADALSRATASIGEFPDPLRPANEINSGITSALAGVLHQAIALNPRQRPQTAAAMRKALREVAKPAVDRSESDTALLPPTIADVPRTQPAAEQHPVPAIPSPTIASPTQRPSGPVSGSSNMSATTMAAGTAQTRSAFDKPIPGRSRLRWIIGGLIGMSVLGVVVTVTGILMNHSSNTSSLKKDSESSGETKPASSVNRDRREALTFPLNKPAPAFQLPQLQDPSKTFSTEEMKGKVWLLNVWASWCVPCREEHPVLMSLSRTGAVPIYGLDWKDKRDDALNWLHQMDENPYQVSFSDFNGRVAIDYGVTGAPETYLIDKNGVIRYKQIGPLTPELLESTILPMVRELNK